MLSFRFQFCLLLLTCWVSTNAAQAEPGAMTIENSFVQLLISPDGKILHCLDRRTGTEFLNPTADPTFAMVPIMIVTAALFFSLAWLGPILPRNRGEDRNARQNQIDRLA